MRFLETWLSMLLLACASCAGVEHAAVTPEAGDRLAVADVVSRFAGAASAHDWVGMTELFTEDAVWSSSVGELSFRHQGRAAMLAWLRGNEANVEVLFYSSGTPAVTIGGDGRAQSRVTMTEVLHVKASGERKLLLGTYVDELAKTNGAWRFTKRHFTIGHVEPLRGTSAP
jgi:hypothetical protein